MSKRLIILPLLLGVFSLLPSSALAAVIEDTDNSNIFTEGGGNWAGYLNGGMIYKPQVTTTSVSHVCFFWGADVAGDSGTYTLDVYNRGAGNFPTGGSNTHLGTSNSLTVAPPDVDIAQHFSNDISSWEENCFEFASDLSWNANDGIAMKINKVSGDDVYVIQGGGSGNPSNDVDFPAVSTGNVGNTGSWYGQAVPVVFRDGPVGPPPATTEYNEVVDYIYDPILDNSFGTSTVGATFSIPEPTWVSSIGFTLRGPLGNLLYTGSTTPSLAGTYDVSVDYYFDTSGAYELQAYFIRDTGERINNPVSVYITVNVPEWAFDPVTGDLVPAASTTIATSTLTNFKIDCPDDLLVGSLCKLAVGLFVPQASAIQGLQASFYGLMNKAPFSFFTQSKTVLDAFRTGSAQTGGSLALTLYGSEIQVVSSSTASSLGVDSGMIDFLKGIMIVGLWLMLAWYLYWRIASIFGV